MHHYAQRTDSWRLKNPLPELQRASLVQHVKGLPYTGNLSTELMGVFIHEINILCIFWAQRNHKNGQYNSNTLMSHEGHFSRQQQWVLGQNQVKCPDPARDPPNIAHITLYVLTLATGMDIYIQWQSLHTHALILKKGLSKNFLRTAKSAVIITRLKVSSSLYSSKIKSFSVAVLLPAFKNCKSMYLCLSHRNYK